MQALGVWFADPVVVAIGPTFVWVIEPDVAYAGQDITKLIRAYSNTDADLVTKGGCVPLPRYNCGTDRPALQRTSPGRTTNEDGCAVAILS